MTIVEHLQAEDMGGSDFLFEDVSEEPVWQHEQRITAQPLDFKSASAVEHGCCPTKHASPAG